jgi:hypothetical protein
LASAGPVLPVFPCLVLPAIMSDIMSAIMPSANCPVPPDAGQFGFIGGVTLSRPGRVRCAVGLVAVDLLATDAGHHSADRVPQVAMESAVAR